MTHNTRLTENLKNRGLKVTIPRVKILSMFEQPNEAGQHHFTAEEIYKRLLEQGEEVSLPTVYRVLTQFEQAGILRRLNFEDNVSRYELDTGDAHDHIVCINTGFVEEFIDEVIEARIQAIAEEKGFKLEGHSLVIYGYKKEF